MKERRIFGFRVTAFLLTLVMVLALTGITGFAGADQPPVAPTEAQEELIEAAADFLEEMDMDDMADNVREWL